MSLFPCHYMFLLLVPFRKFKNLWNSVLHNYYFKTFSHFAELLLCRVWNWLSYKKKMVVYLSLLALGKCLLGALRMDIIIFIYSKQIKLRLLGCTNNCRQGLEKISWWYLLLVNRRIENNCIGWVLTIFGRRVFESIYHKALLWEFNFFLFLQQTLI